MFLQLTGEFVKSRNSVPRIKRIAACMVGLLAVFCQTEASTGFDSRVGEASLVLGNSIRVSAEGDVSELKRGSEVIVGDRIETRSNGHVHLRFSDGALVSVRPNSSLVIERYEFDSDNPSRSAVKFKLEEGVTRAISGEAAKAARDRFRLNTPIAAIGVRGTDFVVRVDGPVTRALVNEGAIIMAPFSDLCTSDGLGPCEANSLELGDDRLRLISLDQNAVAPRILTAQNLNTPSLIQEAAQRAIANTEQARGSRVRDPQESLIGPSNPKSEQDIGNEVLLEGVTTVQVRAEAKTAADIVSATDFIPEEPLAIASDGTIPGFDYTPPKILTNAQLSDRQLVWGRYFTSPLSTDRLTLSFKEASEFRSPAVGTFEYGLFRADTNGRSVAVESDIVGFQLTSAQAIFNSQTGIVAMSVSGGRLDINFLDNSFTTGLSMSSDLTGQVEFTASGNIFDGGFLRALEETQSLRGAISFDGLEAGYQFEKELLSGKVSGLTLWDSK
jgi:hypothetical protein